MKKGHGLGLGLCTLLVLQIIIIGLPITAQAAQVTSVILTTDKSAYAIGENIQARVVATYDTSGISGACFGPCIDYKLWIYKKTWWGKDTLYFEENDNAFPVQPIITLDKTIYLNSNDPKLGIGNHDIFAEVQFTDAKLFGKTTSWNTGSSPTVSIQIVNTPVTTYSSITVTARYPNGGLVPSSEVNGMVLYQDSYSNVYQKKDPLYQNPFTFGSLATGHQYLVEVYVNDMYSGDTGWISLGSTSVSKDVTTPQQARLQVTTTYSDGSILPYAAVKVSAHNGDPWRSLSTSSNGIAEFWLQPTTKPGEYYNVIVYDSGTTIGSQTGIKLSTGQTLPITIATTKQSIPPPTPLQVFISASPTSGTAPLGVQFTASVSGGRTPYSYSWNFGDGYTDSSSNPSHTYGNAGTYTVILTVTDANGQSKSSTTSISVQPPVVSGGGGGTPGQTYSVTITIPALTNLNNIYNNAGLSVSIDGTTHSYNDVVQLSAGSHTVQASQQNGWTIGTWTSSGGVSVNCINCQSTTVNVSGDGPLGVIFLPIVSISLDPLNGGTITVNYYSCSGGSPHQVTYSGGQAAIDITCSSNLIANPASGYSFASWSAADTLRIANANVNPTSWNPVGPGNITVHFQQVTGGGGGGGGGTVAGNNLDFFIEELTVDKANYQRGENVQLWAKIDNSGNMDIKFSKAYFTITSPSGSTVFTYTATDSLVINPGQKDILSASWTVPTYAEQGYYTLKGTVTAWQNSDGTGSSQSKNSDRTNLFYVGSVGSSGSSSATTTSQNLGIIIMRQPSSSTTVNQYIEFSWQVTGISSFGTNGHTNIHCFLNKNPSTDNEWTQGSNDLIASNKITSYSSSGFADSIHATQSGTYYCRIHASTDSNNMLSPVFTITVSTATSSYTPNPTPAPTPQQPAKISISFYSRADDNSINLGSIVFDGKSYSLSQPIMIEVSKDKWYVIDAVVPNGYSFAYWDASRNIQIDNSAEQRTSIKIGGDATITAVFKSQYKPPPKPIQPPKPEPFTDLTIQDIYMTPTEAQAGDHVKIGADIRNIGTKEVDGVTAEMILDGKEFRTKNTFYVVSEGTSPVSFDWIATPGTHTATWIVDPDNLISESNKNNNKLTKTFVIGQKFGETKQPSNISTKADKSQLNLGDKVIISGSLEPALSVRIRLTFMQPDMTQHIETVNSNSDGTFSLSFSPNMPGTWSVSASWEGNEIYKGSASSMASFRVIGGEVTQQSVSVTVVDMKSLLTELKPKDIARFAVKIKNTGDTAWTYYIGFTLQDSAGKQYNFRPKSVKLNPSEQGTVRVTWKVPSNAREGTYTLISAVWKNNPTFIKDQDPLDRKTVVDAFTISTSGVFVKCSNISGLQAQVNRYQHYSIVKGSILNIQITDCSLQQNGLQLTFDLTNTRDAMYTVDVFTGPGGEYKYSKTIFIDEKDKLNFIQNFPKYVSGTNSAYLARLDVNVAASVYLVSYIFGNIIGFSPSDQTLWSVTQEIKQNYFADEPFLNSFSLDGLSKWAQSFGDYMKKNPNKFVQIAAESGLNYTVDKILEKASVILSIASTIADSVQSIGRAIRNPAEETIDIEFSS